jgi:hypothetical protein
MVLFAYFDESGKPDSSNFVCIAGYASDDDGWNKFCDAWPKLLNKHHIGTSFFRLHSLYRRRRWHSEIHGRMPSMEPDARNAGGFYSCR